MVFAFLILNQAPTQAEWIGGSVIIIGILMTVRFAVPQFGSRLPWMETKSLSERPGPFTGV